MLPGVRWIIVQEKANLRKLLPPEIGSFGVILDIGTGTGSSLDIFPENLLIVAVDQSVDMLKQAIRRRSGAIAVAASANALPFKSSVFDFCSCIGVTEYFSRPGIPLAEIHRILTDSGRLLITFPKFSGFNFLRIFLGHPVYLRNAFWKRLLNDSHFSHEKMMHSWLQVQIPARKS